MCLNIKTVLPPGTISPIFEEKNVVRHPDILLKETTEETKSSQLGLSFCLVQELVRAPNSIFF